jgi:putative ABC transport system permease protein
MFSYHLKSAFRYFSKQKVFISINILGLIIAFAVSSLIMLYVINELKYDSQHKNRGRIYRVLNNRESIQSTDALTTLDIGPLIKERFPEVEKMSRVVNNRASVLKQQEEIPTKTVFVDPDFLEMFTLNSPQIVTSDLISAPDAVVISKKLAQTVFGNDYPVGKNLQIKFPQGKEGFFKITGIVQNPGEFSSVNGDLFMNFEYYENNLCDAFLAAYPFFTTFLMVPPGSDISFLEEKINKANRDDWTGISTNKYELQKYSRMYLHSANLSNSFFPSGNSKFLYGLLFLVTLVVIMACLNFAILSTACALKRNKEIGIRKINGATLEQVKRQIMFESFLQVIIALPVALFTARLLLPLFNHFVSRALVFSISGNLAFIAGISFLSLLTATLSGLITASKSVKVNPVQLLRKETRKFEFSMNLTRFLLTGQMIVVISFLALTFIIQKQIHFSTSKGLGYSPENILVCSIINPNYKNDLYNPQYENPAKLEDLKSKLSASSAVENISIVHEAPPLRDQLGSGVIIFPETQKSMPISAIACNAEFPEFMGYRLKEGSYFSKDYSGSHEKEIIINETAVKYLGLDNPVGQIVDMDGAKSVKIVGVVYDFNFQSMRKEIVPVRIRKTDKFLRSFDVVIRYRPEMGDEAIAHFNSVFSGLFQEYETEITFHEDKLKALYEKETAESRIFTFGIALAVFIAMMGIFGISLFTVRQQIKEIGIRKINGAAVTDILSMLNLVIIKWVAIAFVIATPIAYYAMNKWLENFAYKTELSWWIFALAGLLALGIALLTLSWQSWRAATRNPVESLRYE